MTPRGNRSALLCLLACLLISPQAEAYGQGGSAAAPQGSGLPVPRFVSLKSDRVHIRQGPGMDHKVLWVFQRAGMPVEVIGEFEGWRQVRDSEGTTGWVLQGLVSGRRTALVLPWEVKPGSSQTARVSSFDAPVSITVQPPASRTSQTLT